MTVRSYSLAPILCLYALAAAPAAHAWQLAQPEEAPGDWGYRPATESEPMNPPGFSWAPEEGAELYHLQVSRTENFRRLSYEITGSRWSSHAPSKSLPKDTPLFWRYRALRGEDGWSDWSTARQFRISPDAVKFPKPPAAKVERRIPEEHPRLFMRPETVDELRERIATDLAPHWKRAVEDAEKVLANPPHTSEPPLYPEGTKRGGEQWKKIWWGNRTYSIAVMEGAAQCAFVYRLGGDERFGRMAHNLMMAFAQWDPRGSTQYDYNDEAAMPLLYWPARTYTWAYDTFTPEERAKIVEVMTIRGRDCFNTLSKSNHLWRPYNSHQNRAWHKLAELAVAFHSEIGDAGMWLDFALTKFFTAYPVWGGADGAWHEGAAYWLSYLDRFNYWAVTMNTSLGIDAFTKPFFSQTGYYPMYTLPPGATVGAWADQGQGMNSDRVGRFVGFLAAQTGNPHWQWYAEQAKFDMAGHGWFGIVAASLLPAAPQPAPPTDIPSSRVFPDTGIAVLNTNLLDGNDNIQVHFKSSPWGSQSHGYNANNAFMLYANGAPLLTLTGKRDVHGSPHHTEWMWHTKSDNAILINNEGQRKHSSRATGLITRHELSTDLDILEGEAGPSYIDQPTRWTRRLFFFKPGVLLVHDILRAPQPSTYQYMLHGNAPFTINGNIATTTYEGSTAQVEYLHPQGLQISQTDHFDTPPYEWAKFNLKQWHLRADTQEKQEQQEFLTAIRINNATPGVAFTKEADGFHITVNNNGNTYTIITGPDGPYTAERDTP